MGGKTYPLGLVDVELLLIAFSVESLLATLEPLSQFHLVLLESGQFPLVLSLFRGF